MLWIMRAENFYLFLFLFFITYLIINLFVPSFLLHILIYLFFLNAINFKGPYAINGVPLRRVNQRYVIATTTQVPLTGVDVSKVDDTVFKREKADDDKEDLANTGMSY